jgi:hypothetical protein
MDAHDCVLLFLQRLASTGSLLELDSEVVRRQSELKAIDSNEDFEICSNTLNFLHPQFLIGGPDFWAMLHRLRI